MAFIHRFGSSLNTHVHFHVSVVDGVFEALPDALAVQPEPQVKPKPRPPSHDLWAALIARIYEVFPLLCPHCGGPMRIVAFITFSTDIHKVLEHIGIDSQALRITPARPLTPLRET